MRNALRLSAAVAAVCVLTALLQAQQSHKATNHEKVLYAFRGETDGYLPNGTLVRDSEGNLYGTTQRGGNNNCAEGGCGVVFKLSATGEFRVLHTFERNDGDQPVNALVQDTSGNLYGMTTYGGAYDCFDIGCGVIFKVTPSGDFTVLYNFTGGSDGNTPMAALIIDPEGNLYGTTHDEVDGGQVFEFTTNGELKVLYNFTQNWMRPDTLVRDSKGNLYGTTLQGGIYGGGIVFKLALDSQVTVLHNFRGEGDGAEPSVLTIDAAGNLYGGTGYGGYEKGVCLNEFFDGCGTVFRVTADGTFSVLSVFNSRDGNGASGLVNGADGNLYGTTYAGGSCYYSYGCGVVFKLAAGKHKDSVLYNFNGKSEGFYPTGLIEDSNHNLYGATLYGGDLSCAQGNSGGCGVIFEIAAK
jgi:uncharacterized repeat protein (TIGR03803 family)